MCGAALPDLASMQQLLRDAGWSQWFHDDYWVHSKTVADPTRQDYTNYGLSTAEAYRLECPDTVGGSQDGP